MIASHAKSTSNFLHLFHSHLPSVLAIRKWMHLSCDCTSIAARVFSVCLCSHISQMLFDESGFCCQVLPSKHVYFLCASFVVIGTVRITVWVLSSHIAITHTHAYIFLRFVTKLCIRCLRRWVCCVCPQRGTMFSQTSRLQLWCQLTSIIVRLGHLALL